MTQKMGSPNLQVFPHSVQPGSRVREPKWNPSFVGSPKVSCRYTCDNFSFDRRPRTEWSAKGSGLQADKSLRGKQGRHLKDLISSTCQDTHSEPVFKTFFSQPKEGNPNMAWGYLHGQVNQTTFPLIYLYVGMDWILKHRMLDFSLCPYL